jgi:hypothetical protein
MPGPFLLLSSATPVRAPPHRTSSSHAQELAASSPDATAPSAGAGFDHSTGAPASLAELLLPTLLLRHCRPGAAPPSTLRQSSCRPERQAAMPPSLSWPPSLPPPQPPSFSPATFTLAAVHPHVTGASQERRHPSSVIPTGAALHCWPFR